MSSLELSVRSCLLFQNDSGSEEEGEKMEVESFVTHVSVPSQKEVEDMLVRRKKRVRRARWPCLYLVSCLAHKIGSSDHFSSREVGSGGESSLYTN